MVYKIHFDLETFNDNPEIIKAERIKYKYLSWETITHLRNDGYHLDNYFMYLTTTERSIRHKHYQYEKYKLLLTEHLRDANINSLLK